MLVTAGGARVGSPWEGTRDGFFRVGKAGTCMRCGRSQWWADLTKCGESHWEPGRGPQEAGVMETVENYLHMAVDHSTFGAPEIGLLSPLGSHVFLCITVFLSESGFLSENVIEGSPFSLSSKTCSALQSRPAFATYSWSCLGLTSIWESCGDDNNFQPHPQQRTWQSPHFILPSSFPSMSQTHKEHQRAMKICKYAWGREAER